MDRVYIQWSIVNWITVILMVGLGAAIIGVALSGFRAFGGDSGES